MEKEKFEFEFLDDFDINSIDVSTCSGRWAKTLYEWMQTDAKACKFTLCNQDEKNRCACALRAYTKKHNLDWTIYPERNKYNVYGVRA